MRGGGRAASAALYPDAECALIIQDANIPSIGPDKGGRITFEDNGTTHIDLDEELINLSWEEQIKTLYSIARVKNLTKVWDKYVQPWLDENCKGKCTLSVPIASTFVDVAVPIADTPLGRPPPLSCICTVFGEPCNRPCDLRTGYCAMCTANSCACSCAPCDPSTSSSEEECCAKAAALRAAAAPAAASDDNQASQEIQNSGTTPKNIEDLATAFDKDKTPW